jgi:ATP-dependent DNA helicase RecQ
MIAGQAARPVLVFCRTREGTEAGARLMLQRLPGLPARFYHAGLEKEERAATEGWFLGSTDGMLFATSAYGLGVDKPDIRTVAHLDVPPSVEAYLQETGRAGRDGLPSTAMLFRSREDLAFATRLADESSRRRYGRILAYALARDTCRRQTLLGLIGQDPVPCAGCDVCEGTAAARPAGEAEIVEFVRAHKRRFTAAQAAAILCGEPGPRAARDLHDCLRGWGALAGWNRDDAEAAIRALAADGEVRIAARGPWAGRLTTGDHRGQAPCAAPQPGPSAS